MAKTKVQGYIENAVKEASKTLSGTSISNCKIEMNMEADGATQLLAEALLMQAQANKHNSDAISKLADALKPIDACAIRITGNNLEDPFK